MVRYSIWFVMLLSLVILSLMLDPERSWGGLAWALLTAFVMYRIGLKLAAPLLLPIEPHSRLPADVKSMIHRHAGGGKVAMAVIREGKVVPGPDGKPRDEARGEGILFVDSTSAVLLATDIRPTRVLGPGVHFMRKDEKIGAVVDLRIQMRRKDVEAQTRDGIWVKFKISARFRIDKTKLKLEEIDLEQVRWPAPYEWSPAQVVLALGQSRVGIEQGESLRWDDIVMNEAVKRAYTLIAEYTFDKLIEPHDPRLDPRESVRRRLEDDVKEALAGRGIAVLGIRLTQFVPRDKRVDVQRLRSWKADWIRRTKILESEGQARPYYNNLTKTRRAEVGAVRTDTENKHEKEHTVTDSTPRQKRKAEMQDQLTKARLRSPSEPYSTRWVSTLSSTKSRHLLAHVPRPSFAQVSQAAATGLRNWWARETTDAMRRRLLILVMFVALGALGPLFIALPIFPDPPTSIPGESDGKPCAYDAALANPPDRLRERTPIPVVSGVTTTLPFDIRNTGTCPWDGTTALRREDGNPIAASQTITPAGTVVPSALFRADITFAVPPVNDALLNFQYRMYAPDGRGFGAPIKISLITYPLGGEPRYLPQRITGTDIASLVLMALPGALGLGLAVRRAGRFTWDFYSLKSVQYGVGFVLRRLFNVGPNVTATVKDGQIDWDSRGGANKGRENDVLEKIGGPGTLSVHGGMEVLLERSARYSRIVGPGVTPLGAFERVRVFVDARPLNRPKDESAYTKDGIEVKCKTTITFKLMKQKDGEQVSQHQPRVSGWRRLKLLLKLLFGFKAKPPEPPAGLPASPQAVRAIAYELPGGLSWESTVSTGIADEIPGRMFDELWAPDSDRKPRRDMIAKLFNDNTESLRKRGVELIDMTIGALEATDKSVDEQRRKYWEAYWESRTPIIEAQGEAEPRDILQIVQDGTRTTGANVDPAVPRIGIVTALPKEYVAVEAVLDNKQDYVARGRGAGRRYLIGEVPAVDGHRHSVALSMAEMGNNIAAVRATLLLEHFPNVKSIIMVGIAGGIPYPDKPDEHVRLGDIVISDRMGVVQYDFDKETNMETIHRHPPRPPSATLLEGIMHLEAAELKRHTPWVRWIEHISRWLGVERPLEETDILASSLNPNEIISHPYDRRRIPGLPRVFHGPIASANKLLKNPITRDRLRDKFGVKAVEMESSGIADATWNHEIGYLVVRGICDYCDSNKGDDWQKYAAVVAAAYTRALLESIPSELLTHD